MQGPLANIRGKGLDALTPEEHDEPSGNVISAGKPRLEPKLHRYQARVGVQPLRLNWSDEPPSC